MNSNEVLKRIERVDPTHAGTMRANPTSFTTRTLPFYRRHRLLVAVVRLRHKPLELRYLDDGREALPLDADAIKRVNVVEQLELGAAEAAPYARFFLEHGVAPRLTVVESADSIPWLPSSDTAPALKQLRERSALIIHPVEVNPEFGAFTVKATVLRERQLVEVTLSLERDGTVSSLLDDVRIDELPLRYVV